MMLITPQKLAEHEAEGVPIVERGLVTGSGVLLASLDESLMFMASEGGATLVVGCAMSHIGGLLCEQER